MAHFRRRPPAATGSALPSIPHFMQQKHRPCRAVCVWYARSLPEKRCRWHFFSPQSPFPRARAKSEARLGRTTKASALLKQSAFGTPEGTRTPDLLLRRQLLYPDELLARIGASDGNRTHAHSLEGCCTSRYTTPALSRSASAIGFYHNLPGMSRLISAFCPDSSVFPAPSKLPHRQNAGDAAEALVQRRWDGH